MSGEVLNEHNPPMTLPNGHVYGTKVCYGCYSISIFVLSLLGFLLLLAECQQF